MRRIILSFGIFLLILASCSKKKTTLFSKISSEKSGIDFTNEIIETDSFNILSQEYIFNGGGVAIGDFNNDDKPDIFFSGNQVPNRLYINQGDFKFKDVSQTSGIMAKKFWNTGVALVDINNDGLLDIYVCSAMLPSDDQKKNLLFINQGLDSFGNPFFKEMGDSYGVSSNQNSMGATFFDYDKDGLLDLYVLNNVDIHVLPANYRKKITDGSALSNDRLYHNNGDGTFKDVTLDAGITIEGFGLGLAISDLNYDGWPDIYVSNDYLANDILYINNQDGTFSNQIKKHIKHQSKFSMGSDISDFDNDGFLDIITLDMLGETNQRLKTTIPNSSYHAYQLNEKFGYEYQYSRNMLHKGNGIEVPFSEIGLMAGVSKTDWSWSPLFADVDNDGYRDLLITNGFPRDITDLDFGDFKFNVSRYLSPEKLLDSIPQVKIPNYAFKYNGKGKFTDIGKTWGLDTPSFSNGAAFADLDGDGDLDYVVNNINDEAFLYKNNTNPSNIKENNFLQISLVGPESNKSGIGAKIVARFEDGTFQMHEHYLNRGYMSTVQDIVHFGLGSNSNISSVEVVWPDGRFEIVRHITINQKILLAYEDSSPKASDDLVFPFVSKNTAPIFKEVSEQIGIDFLHEEEDIVDYNLQRILPHKLTQNGPCLMNGDLNGDKLEDFIIGGSAGFSSTMFIQNEDGSFSKHPLVKNDNGKEFEVTAMELFDLDSDGDLDLYLVSGSNEFVHDSGLYKDRVLVNDGKGNFTLATNKSSEINTSGSTITAEDYDKDGFVDVFVGGRTPFGQYPLSEKSSLLRNVNGTLEDVTNKLAPELREVGMVTDAVWADIDSDGLQDLVIVGELMPITVFKNEKTSFRKLEETGLKNLIGWWECIVKSDFDNDGDMDFVVGNLGSNNFYQPSQERPTTLIAKDYDNNGTIDPVMFAYFKNSFEDPVYKSFPVNFWGDLYGQSPLFRAKYKSYKKYSEATANDLFNNSELTGSIKLVANFDRSIYLENLGNGKFNYSELPWETQISPINGLAVTDYDSDGNNDILVVGNDFGNEVFIGRYDALNGSILKGDGKGGFKAIKTMDSGFLVPGDAKDIKRVKSAKGSNPYYIVSQNRDKLLVFREN